MDSNSTQLCRLCLETSDNLVNIFESFQDSTIASILTQHFWFKIHKDDGLHEWICDTCWLNAKTFHIFYKRVKFRHANYWHSILKSVGADLIKQERSVTPDDKTFVPDSDIIIKSEVIEQPTEDIDLQICKIGSFASNDEQNEIVQSPDDYDVVQSSTTEKKSRPSKSERDIQDAQIREFFTMECDICSDTKFETLVGARHHYRKVHNVEGYLVCCGKKYQRRCMLLEHMVLHTNPSALRCDTCDKSFSSERALKFHTENHLPIDSRAYTYKCSLCPISFGHASRLKYHVEFTHPKKDKSIPCDKCNKSFRSKHLLASHIRCVHESSFKIICDICAGQFKTKQLLRIHIANKHSTKPLTSEPKVQCNRCGVWLKHKLGLRRHLLRHDEDSNAKDNVVNCTICNKEVTNKRSLQKHMRYVHGDKTNNRCVMCDKTFKSTKTLKEHIAIHLGEDLYSCPYCEKKFKSNANMYSHRKKAHLAEWTRDFGQRSALEKESKPTTLTH